MIGHTKVQSHPLVAVADRRCPLCGGTVLVLDNDSSSRRILSLAGVLCLCCEACQVHHYGFSSLRLSFTRRQLASLALLTAWVSVMVWWILG